MDSNITALTVQAHLVITSVMCGIIWWVQIVHYPMFSSIGADEFVSYHARNVHRTTMVVGPVMLMEAGLAFCARLFVARPKHSWHCMDRHRAACCGLGHDRFFFSSCSRRIVGRVRFNSPRPFSHDQLDSNFGLDGETFHRLVACARTGRDTVMGKKEMNTNNQGYTRVFRERLASYHPATSARQWFYVPYDQLSLEFAHFDTRPLGNWSRVLRIVCLGKCASPHKQKLGTLLASQNNLPSSKPNAVWREVSHRS